MQKGTQTAQQDRRAALIPVVELVTDLLEQDA
jgi:hypothetical protein